MKRAVAWSLLHSGALEAWGARLSRGRGALLLYHRVNDEGDPFFPSLPRAVFRRQLDYIAAHYATGSVEDFLGWMGQGCPGRSMVCITIDDGYTDTLDVVLPELEARGLTATLFLSTGPPETGQPLWIEKARWMMKHARSAAVDLPAYGLAGPLGTGAERCARLGPLLRILKTLGPEGVAEAMDALERALDPDGPPLKVLRWDDVRRLAAGPIRLGAHAHLHYMLSRLDDRALREEVSTSKRLIEERCGIPVTTFAYPNGEAIDYDARAIALLKELGFRGATTSRHGTAHAKTQPFEIPRLYTSEASLPMFAARLAGLGHGERERPEVS